MEDIVVFMPPKEPYSRTTKLLAAIVAAFADSIDTCEKKLGIDKKQANFGMPLAQLL